MKNADIRATKFWETDLQTANVHTSKMDENTSFYMAKVAGATFSFEGWGRAKNTEHAEGADHAKMV